MRDQASYKHYTRGGQISFHNLRMWDQITKTLSIICFFIWIIAASIILWSRATLDSLQQTVIYYSAYGLKLIKHHHVFQVSFQGKTYLQSVDAILHYPYYKHQARATITLLETSALYGLGIALLVGASLAIYFIKRGKAQSDHAFIRGSQFKPSQQLRRHIIKAKKNSDITIDGFPLLKESEMQHLLVHGTVGTGKSQLIMKIMDALRHRGDRVIVYDKGCAFIPHYYDPKRDVILNPFDKRCPHWDLWTDAPRESDLENMAESLIPLQGDSDPFWVNAARTIFVNAASRMRDDKERSLEKLLTLLLTSTSAELEDYLQGTPAATLVSSKIEKTATSIRTVIATYVKSLIPLTGLKNKDQPSFSIRNYLLEHQQNGWLFISSNGESHKSLKPLISLWLALASLTLLSLSPDRNRRIWFICDELPSLHQLPLLGETMAEVRKFGGCYLLGMQSVAQLTKVYGQAGAKEIFDLLNTRFFFRSTSSDMAQLVSRELGEEDIEESREHYSYGANSIRDGISLGNHRVTRPIVSYPEILNLKDLMCYLRLPGDYPITQLSLTLTKRISKEPGFIERSHVPSTIDNQVSTDVGASVDDSAQNPVTRIKRKHKLPVIEYLD